MKRIGCLCLCALVLALITAPLLKAQTATTDKTLVSWVTVSNPNITRGSVLTVQEGDRFDGIIFAELASARWMAGSDHFRRTDRNQADYPQEEADADALVQLALVYRGDQILLYRNGMLYESHQAQNIDLLSSKNSIVVFGLRHVGGDGAFGGVIDDARIFNRALSLDEIRSLKPNQAISIKPHAWWDFNDSKIVDRTWRYGYSRMGGVAKLADGKLVLGQNAVVVAGQSEAIVQGVEMPYTGP